MEKGENTVTDIVLFSYYVFKIFFLQSENKKIIIRLNPFPNKPWFSRVCRTSLLKTPWEKEKLLVTSNFSFSHGVFYPFGELSATFIKFEIVVCKVRQFGRVLNLWFGRGLNHLCYNPASSYEPCRNWFFKKTLREKDKLLQTSIFSFPHKVFSPSKFKTEIVIRIILSSLR